MKLKIGRLNISIWLDEKKQLKGGRPAVRINADEVLKLRSDGLSIRKIADKLGVSKSTIFNVVHNPEKYR